MRASTSLALEACQIVANLPPSIVYDSSKVLGTGGESRVNHIKSRMMMVVVKIDLVESLVLSFAVGSNEGELETS